MKIFGNAKCPCVPEKSQSKCCKDNVIFFVPEPFNLNQTPFINAPLKNVFIHMNYFMNDILEDERGGANYKWFFRSFGNYYKYLSFICMWLC